MYHGIPSKFLCYLCCMKNFSHGMTIKSRQLRDLSINNVLVIKTDCSILIHKTEHSKTLNITYGAHVRGNCIELKISKIKVKIVSCKEIVERGFTYQLQVLELYQNLGSQMG